MGVLNTQLISATTLAAGTNIPVGNVVHKSSCNLNASGNTWRIDGAGYYRITASVTVEPAAVAAMPVTLNDNGVTIAQASATPAVADDSVNVSLVAVIYNKCNCQEDAITLTLGAAGTVTESDVVIERI